MSQPTNTLPASASYTSQPSGLPTSSIYAPQPGLPAYTLPASSSYTSLPANTLPTSSSYSTLNPPASSAEQPQQLPQHSGPAPQQRAHAPPQEPSAPTQPQGSDAQQQQQETPDDAAGGSESELEMARRKLGVSHDAAKLYELGRAYVAPSPRLRGPFAFSLEHLRGAEAIDPRGMAAATTLGDNNLGLRHFHPAK